MNGCAALPIAGGDERHPVGQLGRAVEHWARVKFRESRGHVGKDAIEHVNHRVRRAGAHAAGFGDIGDEECLAAGGGELCGHRLKA